MFHLTLGNDSGITSIYFEWVVHQTMVHQGFVYPHGKTLDFDLETGFRQRWFVVQKRQMEDGNVKGVFC